MRRINGFFWKREVGGAFHYVVWELPLDEGVVGLAEVQLDPLPGGVGGDDEGEPKIRTRNNWFPPLYIANIFKLVNLPASGLFRVRVEHAVHPELPQERSGVAWKEMGGKKINRSFNGDASSGKCVCAGKSRKIVPCYLPFPTSTPLT